MIRYILLVLIYLATLIPVAPTAEAASEASWNVTCNSVRWATDDPIVFPGQPGKSHMHTFYGNTTTNANTTTQSLLNSGPSDCQREFQDADHSAYWIPALYRKHANGTLEELKATPKDFSMTIYYRRAGGTEGEKVTAIPQGLRMLAGDPKATTPQKYVSIRCQNTKDGSIQNKSSQEFPTCASTEHLLGDLKFPNCWDGKNLDSADHRSHMTYSSGKTHACPASHPVKIPQLTFEPRWKAINGPGSSFMFSSGGPYTFHGDFFAAWDPKVQAALVNQCPNAGVKCNFKKLSELKLNLGAVPDSQIKAQTFGAGTEPRFASAATDHSNHQPTPAPAAAAGPLPQTGPLTVFSTVAGIGAMGYAYHAYRDRRRALRASLLRKRP
jgi:hypothetical protein